MGRSTSLLLRAALIACVCLGHMLVSADVDENLDEIILEWEQVLVNIGDEPTFGLMVEPNSTVLDLMQTVYELEGMLCHPKNKSLDQKTKLYEYIRAGIPVNLVLPENGDVQVELIVRTHDGRELPVTTQLSNSVSSLKDIIAQWSGVAHTEQRLLLSGKKLEDGRKLLNHYIYNGTSLNLGRPLEDCNQVVTISVKTLSGATIRVTVNLADTAADLKKEIWKKTGVPAGVQSLYTNRRSLTGADHLCDHGLEAGSTVYLFLYSPRITSLDQVAMLREPPVARPAVDPLKAPIFREAEDLPGAVQSGRRRRPYPLYKDARNWVDRYHAKSLDLFDPVAHLKPNPDSEDSLRDTLRESENALLPNASAYDRLQAPIIRAQYKLSSAVRPYRVIKNLTSYDYRQSPGIDLGGGSTDVNLKRPISLGADVNNWAPDAFSDSDLMRLFEVRDRVRQVLAMDAHTGEGTLSFARQWKINRAILSSYVQALAGYQPAVEYNHPREDEECAICRDDLKAEPAIELACRHAMHADCILSWTTNLYNQKFFPTCPICRQRFMLPYEVQGRAELETHELRGNQDDK